MMLDDQIEFLYLMMMVTFTGFGHYPIFHITQLLRMLHLQQILKSDVPTDMMIKADVGAA